MKIIIYTQRVDIIDKYNERRDAADQNIPKFIEYCGYLPIPIPNALSSLNNLIDSLKPVGIILTGGNSLVKYNGNAPERDFTDKKLIELAIEKNIPLFGFCRGMQSILDYFECKLCNIENHVAIQHKINGEYGQRIVNSYHNQGALELKKPLLPIAISEDGIIEAIRHENKKIIAIMWHPERKKIFDSRDVNLIKNLFN